MLTLPDFRYKQIAFHFAGGSGHRLKFKADNIVICDENDKVLFQHSCHRLFALFLIGEINVTSVVIRQAVAFAFPIVLMNRNLKVIAVIHSGAEGNTLLRKKQYEGSRNQELARLLIRQKIENQIALLKTLRKPAEADREAVSLLENIRVDSAEDTRTLMGMEGFASRTFFKAYFRPLGWNRREPRCKRDIYNLLLDIGYTYLFNYMEAMLALYGFDLYCGVHHTFFYQRKSLVCDLVEPFRCIIDRRLRKAYNLNQIHPEDFYLKDYQYCLMWKAQKHYTELFVKDLLKEKERIFLFCQQYYRWVMKDKKADEFPVYKITGEE